MDSDRLLLSLLFFPAMLQGQAQAIQFLDDSHVQVIDLTMDAGDWAALQQNYQLDTYYHATFAWNGISEDIGVRSHGGGSRSPVKPNLDLNFAKYDKNQTFLGLPFVIVKANNEGASNLKEWISMKVYRKMGIPAPREAPAQVYINGQLLGFYFFVEHEDETFLQRNFGESGGYLYEWQPGGNYDFENLGTDPSTYAPFLDLKTKQAAPDLQTFENLVQIVNQPPGSTITDDAFLAGLSQFVDPNQFPLYGATEQMLAGSDSLIGGLEGMNNFFLYQFQGTTRYYFIPWDKDFTFSDASRDIMDGLSTGPNINLLAKRLVAIPQYKQAYLAALARAAALVGGTGGWVDGEIDREYAVIHDAALNDPNKQCMTAGVLYACGTQDFEQGVQWLHTFLASRSDFVLAQINTAGYQPSTSGARITGVTSFGGDPAISPGGLSTVAGTALATTAQASGTPLPRVLGNTFVSIEGVRAPLVTTAPNSLAFEVPEDIPIGSASVVIFANGESTGMADVTVQASTPSVVAVVHQGGSQVSAALPAIAGETLSIYATGLGALNTDLPAGAAGPADATLTTAATPQVLLGGIAMSVTYSGLAPGYVGLY